MHRIVVIGTSASGKSTLASRLALALEFPHIELDSLHWNANWTEVPTELFRERLRDALSQPTWIVDGNYSVVRDLIWPNASTIVWLDYSFPLVLWRVFSRTWRRVISGETCCNGNRETIRQAFSRDSVIWWVLTTYHRRRREFLELLPTFANSGQTILVFRRPRDAEQWLKGLKRGAGGVNPHWVSRNTHT